MLLDRKVPGPGKRLLGRPMWMESLVWMEDKQRKVGKHQWVDRRQSVGRRRGWMDWWHLSWESKIQESAQWEFLGSQKEFPGSERFDRQSPARDH